MNKIHRVVWSDARQALVVTDERSSGVGKPSTKRRLLAPALVSALLGLGAGQAMANSCANPTGSNTFGTTNFGTDPCTLGTGGSATVSGGTVTFTGDGLQVGELATFFVSGGAATGITFDANGTISAATSRGVQINGPTGSLTGNITNNGAINSGGHGIELISGATMTGNVINNGTITTGSTFGDSSGITVNGGSVLTGSIVNGGTITSNIYGIYITGSNALVTGSITNSGTIAGGTAGIAVTNTGSVAGGISNSGTVSSTTNGIWLNGGTLPSLSNTGTISGTTRGVYVQTGTITTLSNQGTITGGIHVGGTITNLNNAQNDLAYTGNLPTNYNVILVSPDSYGKLVVTTPSGTTNFGIHSSSTGGPGTYTSVLSGVTAGNLVATTGSLGPYIWTLINSSGNLWDLTLAGTVYSSTLSRGNGVGLPAARVIDQSGNLLALFSGQSTAAQQSNAVTQTLPLLTGGSLLAAQSVLSGINRVIQARLEGNSGISSGDDFFGDRHVWLKPFGSHADQDDRNGVSGYDADTYGLAFGVDGTITPATRLGAAFAYAKSDIDSHSTVAPQNADVSVYQLIGYGSHSLDDRTEINLQADIGRNTNKGKRQIAFTSSTASSNYDSYTGHVGVGLGRIFPLSSQTTITPSIRADYTWIKDKAYTENGAGLLNLHVDSRTTEAFVLSANGKIAHQLNDQATLTANLGVGYDTMSERSAITSAFAGAPGAAFVTRGIDPSPWIGQGGLGVVYKTKSGLELAGRYDVEYRESFLNQTASIKARWVF